MRLLSKSRYLKGLQCTKALYLDTFHPQLGRISRETRLKFAAGRDFEHRFKGLFPNGIDLSKELGWHIDRYPTRTRSLLSQEGERVLFEAGFLYDGVLILADVVHKRADGNIHIYEVKNTSRVTPVIRHDVHLQHYVVSHCVSTLEGFDVVYRNDAYSPDMAPEALFLHEDLTAESEAQASLVADNIATFKSVLAGLEPCVAMGEQCSRPYECPYQAYCQGRIPTQTSLQTLLSE